MTQWTPNPGYAAHPMSSLPCSALTPPAHQAPIAPTVPSQAPVGSVTIDLTCDDVEKTSSSPTNVPAASNNGEGLRSTMRSKNYDWLGDKNHMQQRLQPMQGPPVPFVHHQLQLESTSVTNHSSPATNGGDDSSNCNGRISLEGEEDELAQLLQEELERDTEV